MNIASEDFLTFRFDESKSHHVSCVAHKLNTAWSPLSVHLSELSCHFKGQHGEVCVSCQMFHQLELIMAVAFDSFACVFDQSTLTSRLVTQHVPSLQLPSKLKQRQYLHRHKELKKDL